jgi:hypothetical protein
VLGFVALMSPFVACSVSAPQRQIEGYPIGAPATCEARCELYYAEARSWLDGVAPSHAAIAQVQAYLPDYRNAQGSFLIADGSGGHAYVMVLALTDGTVRAVQVVCGIGIEPDICQSAPPTVVPQRSRGARVRSAPRRRARRSRRSR